MALIDKETIRAEIERRHSYQKEMYNKTKPDGRPNDGWAESLAIMGELEELRFFLDTLPAQPAENLDAEIGKWIVEDCGPSDFNPYADHWCADDIQRTARHFYELGCTRTAEIYDDIEYERQRAEEAEQSVEEMFKELGTTKEEYLAKSMDKVHLEMEIATYLQDWEDDDEIGLHLSTDEGYIPIELEDIRDLARHFAEWGAKHGKK